MRTTTTLSRDRTAITVGHLPGAHSVAVTVAVGSGTTSERRGQASFAHLVEHLLHHYGTDEAGVVLERHIHEVGGISNAQTYPFHTEYSFVLSRPERISELARWVRRAQHRLRWPTVAAADLDAEKAVIAQEVGLRMSASPLAGFPWKDALGTRSDDYAFRHDGFTILDDVSTATIREVRAYFDSTYPPARMAISVVGDLDPDAVAATLEVDPVLEAGPMAAPDPLRGLDRAFQVESITPGMGGWARAEVRRIDGGPASPAGRASAMVGVQVANLLDPTRRVQAGLFGAEFGPDHQLLLTLSSGLDSQPDVPGRAPDLAHLLRSASANVMDAARRRALDRFDRFLAATATFSALLARDALFGIDTAQTRQAIEQVSIEDVIEILDQLTSQTPGVLIRRGREASAEAQATEETA